MTEAPPPTPRAPEVRGPPETAPLPEATDELPRLRAERDELAARLDKRSRRQARGGAARRIVVGLLVLLTALSIPIAATLAWAHRTVLNTDRYLATVAPLASNPTVTTALALPVHGLG